MYSHAHVTGAQKRMCVDCMNMPNHHTSISFGWGGYEACMAVKAYYSKVHAQSVAADLYTPQGVDLGGGGSSS